MKQNLELVTNEIEECRETKKSAIAAMKVAQQQAYTLYNANEVLRATVFLYTRPDRLINLS